ncbi:hypothetical protein KR222_007867, partial [Zaprionus bogoriensis]
MQFENFSCSSSRKPGNPVEHFNCGLSKNVKRRTLHMEFALRESLADYDFHICIVLPRRSVDFLLLNVTTDGCQLLSNKNQVPLMRISREILDRYSNFPRQCPFQGGKSYYIRGFRLDLGLIPAVTMETPVRMIFEYRRKKLKLLQGDITAHVQRTTNAKKKD